MEPMTVQDVLDRLRDCETPEMRVKWGQLLHLKGWNEGYCEARTVWKPSEPAADWATP
jgi:hypothetical protein